LKAGRDVQRSMYAARRLSLVTMSVCFRIRKYRRHHQIARREAVAIEVGLVAKRLRERGQPPLNERDRARAAQLRPLLVRVEEIDQQRHS
jgi:hypothetical protein